LRYDNLRRDFNGLMSKLGVTTDGAFHALRRTFATNFAREGGNLFALQNILGHASIQTTQRYIGLSLEDLKRSHAKTSLLNRLRV
jgi:integrase/recombinase XerD